MKIVNKILTITVLISVLVSSPSVSQNVYILGGLNISQLNLNKQSSSEQRSYRPGFQIGSAIDISINENLDFSPRLLFSLKREFSTIYIPGNIFSPAHSGSDIYQFNSYANDYYLDLPLNIKYSFIMGNLRFFALAGPFFNLMLFDDSRTEVFINGEKEDVIFSTLPKKFSNRIDYGLNAGIGLDLKSYIIQASYDYGFFRTQKYKDFDFDNSLRNSVLRLTLGYKI